MSEDQLKAFLQAVAADPNLGQQLRASGADPVAIARAAGFAIELQELLRHQASLGLELSEEELETAAGGVLGKSSKKDACTQGCACLQLTIPASAGTLDPCMHKCSEL